MGKDVEDDDVVQSHVTRVFHRESVIDGAPVNSFSFGAGNGTDNKYSLLGGIRASAQMVSYELAAGVSIIAVFMLSETLSLREIVHLQSQPLWGNRSLLVSSL